MDLEQITSVVGLPPEELDMLNELLDVWRTKLDRNQDRLMYYNMKNTINDLGIAIPPSLVHFKEVVGWAAKAVDSLAVLSRFDGFTTVSGENDALQDIVESNHLKRLYRQMVTSELTQSVAFMTVSKGDVSDGEPPVIISPYSALNAAATWDYRRKRIRTGLTVVDMQPTHPHGEPEPVWVNLYTDDCVWEIRKDDTGTWRARENPHDMGRPVMVPFAYKSSIDRPFGKSRITREVMSLVDAGVRESLRGEIAAEFAASPQKYLLGADDDTFSENSKWEAYIGSIFAITSNQDGDIPHYGQLPQPTLQPHMDFKRDIINMMAAATGVPPSEFGARDDQPASFEAMQMQREPLILDARDLNEDNGDAMREVARIALATARGKTLDELTDEERAIIPHFRNPAAPSTSVASVVDAGVKIASQAPWFAETDEYLEYLGFDEATRRKLARARDEWRARQEELMRMQMALDASKQ